MAESLDAAGLIAAFPSISRPVVAVARGHISIFYPALIILDLYVCTWALLVAMGQGGTPITRVIAIVCFVVVPMLFVYAFLRFMTVSVIVTKGKVLMRRGWPFSGVYSIAREDLRSAHSEFSYFGKLVGSGSLTVTTISGDHHRVKDIGSPDRIAARLNASIERAAEASTGVAWTT